MTATTTPTPLTATTDKMRAEALIPMGIGLAAMYVPSFIQLFNTLWQTDEQSHAPLILAASAWLLYDGFDRIAATAARPARVAGAVLLAIGLLLYILGRSQHVVVFEVGSLIPVIAGCILVARGWQALRIAAFPVLFMAFAAPLPGFIIDAITSPLKLFVSATAEQIMYLAGYPVARDGVGLAIGQYRLLVADACSGLNSLVSLIAVGVFFMYIVGKRPRLHNVLVALSLPLIAIAANVLRVVALALITYYFGDEAAQGFIHGLTGVFLFVVALVLLFGLDILLTKLIPNRTTKQAS